MHVRLLTTEEDLTAYDQWVKNHPHGTLWQSLERKAYLEASNKEVRVYAHFEKEKIVGSALVAIDRTTGGYSTWDIPRGPLVSKKQEAESEKLLDRIVRDAKTDQCMALYLSPVTDLPPTPYSLLPSKRHIHCEATRVLDLTLSNDEILKQMKQKGRYNIRVAKKNGVRVEQSNRADLFYNLVKDTAARDKFTPLSKSHYERFLQNLEGSFLLLAYCDTNSEEKETKPIAGLLGVSWNKMGIYYYGASDYAHRALMAPYMLQWEAMQLCKKAGCTSYDLLGVAPPDAGKSHPWKGITRFKEQFGGELLTYPAERQLTLKPIIYSLLNLKRRFF